MSPKEKANRSTRGGGSWLTLLIHRQGQLNGRQLQRFAARAGGRRRQRERVSSLLCACGDWNWSNHRNPATPAACKGVPCEYKNQQATGICESSWHEAVPLLESLQHSKRCSAHAQ